MQITGNGVISNFFCNSNNHLVRMLYSYDGQDKVFKACDAVFQLITLVSLELNASQPTMANIGTAHNLVISTRDLTSLLTIFRGVIPSTIVQGRKVIKITKSFSSNVNQDSNSPVGAVEKILKIAEGVFSIIGNLAVIFGFGISRPIGCIDKYLDVGLGENPRKLGAVFPSIMAVNNMTSFLKNSCELAYEIKSYKRQYAVKMLNNQSKETPYLQEKLYSNLFILILSLVDKVLEIIKDIFMFTKSSMPAGVKVLINISIATLGLITAWKKVANG
ncbi:MAG: hypothetical protein R3E91_04450 [Chlamydiales bacterium]